MRFFPWIVGIALGIMCISQYQQIKNMRAAYAESFVNQILGKTTTQETKLDVLDEPIEMSDQNSIERIQMLRSHLNLSATNIQPSKEWILSVLDRAEADIHEAKHAQYSPHCPYHYGSK